MISAAAPIVSYAHGMHTTRLEAFSDAVIAIIMTIMVLELRPPEGAEWTALLPLIPAFLAYVLSFLYLGIYWNNHHHMMHATDHVDGRILWANMHLLFWLSLVPFATAWMAENDFAEIPTVLYGCVLLMAAVAYFILSRAIMAHKDANHDLREAVGKDVKGKISLVAYVLAIPLAFVEPRGAIAIFALVALVWLVPDPRIERLYGHR